MKKTGSLTDCNRRALLFAPPLLGIAALTFLNRDITRSAFFNCTYYLVAAAVVLWIWGAVKYLQAENFQAKKFIAVHWAGLLAALMLTGIIGVSVKPAMRVLSDEANIACVARTMLYKKTVENSGQGFYYYNNFQPITEKRLDVEKRPFLLPFVIQSFHAVLGYDVRNVILANLFFLFLTLFAIYLFLSRHMERMWVFTAMICVAAQPLVSQCATSGGQDLCAAFCLLISMISLKRWLEKPEASYRFEFFFISVLLTANSRPESLISVAMMTLVPAFFGCFKEDLVKSKLWIFASAPILLLPAIWQRLLIRDQFENKLGQTPFSLANFFHNNQAFLKSLVDFKYYLPYATVINAAAVVAIIYFLSFVLGTAEGRKKFFSKKDVWISSLVLLFIVLQQWILFTSYFNGDPAHPSDARYYVFICILLSVAAVLFVRRLAAERHQVLFFMLSFILFFLYNPVSIENQFSNSQILPRQYVYVMDFLKKNASKNALIIAERPGHYVIYEYGAVGFRYAIDHKSQILTNFSTHLFNEVYVIQDISYKDDMPVPGQRLPVDYQLKPVAALQSTALEYTRISMLVNSTAMPAAKAGKKNEKGVASLLFSKNPLTIKLPTEKSPA